jgi:glyceraldehyde-3-phosphate dehydrogenase (NADP+)
MDQTCPTFLPFIAGEPVRTEQLREMRSPFDGRLLASVGFCGPAELVRALAAGQEAEAAARALTSQARAEACARVALALERRRDQMAGWVCDESGKPIQDAYAEVDRAVHCFEIASAEAQRTAREGQLLPLDVRPAGRGRLGITRRVPLGLVVGITPFNFPLNLAVHKIAPAMAAGCPIVLKPAEQTPISTLLLAEIIRDAGWPPQGLSVVPAERDDAELLVTDERPRLLSFTGSARVGWVLKGRAGRKKVALELGGNAAVIIDETVTEGDLGAIIPKLIYGAYSYAGQKCISVQRIYVVDPYGRRHAQFVERFVAAARALRIGDPRDPEVLVGPLIDEANARRVEEWIAEAVAAGARLLCGGSRRGAVVEPAVLCDVPPDVRLSTEEVFGPVCHIERVAEFPLALQRVNDSPYGLQAALFTRDLGHSLQAFEELEVGAVILNEAPSFRIDHMPYGGVKASGLGREGIRNAIEEMTEIRLLVTGAL